MWTQDDLRYLRSLRIESTNPPEPLPRFQVEPSEVDGEYRVIDRTHPTRKFEFGPMWPDPRRAAEDYAHHLNASQKEETP